MADAKIGGVLLVAGGSTLVLLGLVARRTATAATLPRRQTPDFPVSPDIPVSVPSGPPIPSGPPVSPAPAARPPAVSTQISAAGAQFVAHFESFKPQLYNDSGGHCTIGIGTLVHRGPCDGTEPAEFKRGITRARAVELFTAHLEDAAATVRRLVKVPLTQTQFDALISFTYNVGGGAFGKSTLLRKLNQGDYVSVPSELARFVYSGGRIQPGLVRRRRSEGRLFKTGSYATT